MKTLTLEELCQSLKSQVDEISLLEVLGISAEDIVDRFRDKVEERFEQLSQEFESEDEADLTEV